MRRLCKWWHRIEHRFGWNTGTHEVWWAGDKLYVGFICDGCNRLSHVHESSDFAAEDLRARGIDA